MVDNDYMPEDMTPVEMEDGIHYYDPVTEEEDTSLFTPWSDYEDEEGDEEETEGEDEGEQRRDEEEPEESEGEEPDKENPKEPEGSEGPETPGGAEELGEEAAEGAGEAAGEAGAEAAAEIGAEAGTEIAAEGAAGGAVAGGSVLWWAVVALLVILGICLIIWLFFIIYNAISPSAGAKSGSSFSCTTNTYSFPFAEKDVPSIPKTHHNYSAIDLMAKDGQPLVAVTNGTIKLAHPVDKNDGGISLTLLGDDGFTYYYAHLEYLDPSIKAGKKVKAGDPVGRSGHSGNATPDAPHLHFGISKLGHPIKGYFPAMLEKDAVARQESPWRTLEAWKKGECIEPGT